MRKFPDPDAPASIRLASVARCNERDLATVVCAKPGGQADLYLLGY